MLTDSKPSTTGRMNARIPPGPRSTFPGRYFLQFRRDPLGFLSFLAREYGDIVHFRFARQHFYLINNPDAIQDLLVTHQKNFVKGNALQRTRRILGDGLLTSEGEPHMKQRRLIQPLFHRHRIAAYGDVMSLYTAAARDRWENGSIIDIHQEMTKLTLRIVGKTLFDADVSASTIMPSVAPL